MATYSLHQDINSRFSYPELIELIFRRKNWLLIKAKYGLTSEYMESNIYKGEGDENEEMGSLHLSKSTLLQIEYLQQKLSKVAK